MALQVRDPGVPLDDLRLRFRAFGLTEQSAGTSYFYRLPDDAGRMLLILQAAGRGAQIYLYPEALGRPPGAVQWFYALLERQGFGMGSKAGPSITLALNQPSLMDTFWQAFGRLLRGATDADGGLDP
jgi:hypothetical protein